MKSNSRALLGLTVLAGLLTAAPSRAEDAVQSCEVPDYLLATESALPKVADAIKSRHPLDILVVGSRSSTINTSEASAYPGRLQAMLKAKLPSVAVNVSVNLQITKTAEEVATNLVKLVEGKRPTLVIWQTGTVDAMRSIDPDDFRSAVVPLFDRFTIMRHWNDQGDFDLFSASPGLELAKRVHDCLGRALSKFVIDAAHVNPAEQN